MSAYLKAMRLERWPRSAALFVGSAAYFYLNRKGLKAFELWAVGLRLLIPFLLTWGISTTNYVINEIADTPFDRHHPTKRNRPLLSGEIAAAPFAAIGAILTVICLGAAWSLFSRPFFYSLLALLVAGFVYNIKPVRTKDIPFIDSISESANNPIRFLIGWYAFAPPTVFPPPSILCAWWAFGNFLMVAKRLSEFRFLKEKARDYRLSHKAYTTGSLVAGMAASAVVFFLAYFYFAVKHGLKSLLLLTPFLLFYFYIFFRKTLREKEIMEEPESLLKIPVFAIYTAVLLLLFLLSFLL